MYDNVKQTSMEDVQLKNDTISLIINHYKNTKMKFNSGADCQMYAWNM